MIKIKRAYDGADADDGTRFLVDRMWPRGIKKEVLNVREWNRQIAPSDDLRRWYGHDPEKWPEFRRRYFEELDKNREAWQPLLDAAKKGTVTLVYSAKNRDLNNAVALKEYLEKKLK
jgi:uncharacterized protein YeaO (DUF488 family)